RTIDGLVRQRMDSNSSASRGPSFSCDEVRPGSIEAMVCEDGDLAALDRQLAAVYSAASERAADERPPRLKAEQRGWIKGRDECWKSDDQRTCVQQEYTRRIAELQARYRLVPATGPVFYRCQGQPANEVVVTFFETQPPTLIAERGDSVALMYRQPSEVGAKYQGRNEVLWETGDGARIQWGYGAPEMQCSRVQSGG
ncbi:MAG: MliC family protein, partial [Acidobacteriota bacterium]|nr:MliC family protein [Acidobacteriota bacterium]